jgi:hypothetical protein
LIRANCPKGQDAKPSAYVFKIAEDTVARLPGKKAPPCVPASAHRGGAVMRSLREFFLGAGVFLGCLFFLMPCAVAGEVTLAWDRNTEPDLAGYKVYVGVESRTYDRVIDAGNETTCVVSGLEEGKTYYFAATAYNSNNLESDFSNEVVTTLSAVSEAYVDPSQQESEPYVDPYQQESDGQLITGDESNQGEGVDLAGEWLWVNRSFAGKSGNSFVEGTLRVFNRGGLWADSSLLYVYESGDREWDERDVYLGSATITALGAGESVDVPFKFKSNSKNSTIYVIAVIDATARLDDIDEENNIVTSDSVR